MLRWLNRLFKTKKHRLAVAKIQKDVRCYIDSNWQGYWYLVGFLKMSMSDAALKEAEHVASYSEKMVASLTNTINTIEPMVRRLKRMSKILGLKIKSRDDAEAILWAFENARCQWEWIRKNTPRSFEDLENQRQHWVDWYLRLELLTEAQAWDGETPVSFDLKKLPSFRMSRSTFSASLALPRERLGFGNESSKPKSGFMDEVNEAVEAILNQKFDKDGPYKYGRDRDAIIRRIGEIMSLLREEKNPTFSKLLFRMIKNKGVSETKCYKRSNLDRCLFSKIRSDKNYHPQKNTVLALIIGLKLDMDEANELMKVAGYSFSKFLKMDVIMEYMIKEKIYDILTVNEILYLFDCPLLGSK